MADIFGERCAFHEKCAPDCTGRLDPPAESMLNALAAATQRAQAAEAEVERLQTAHAHTAQNAGAEAQEARTQRGIVLAILRHLGVPLRDWEAESAVCSYVDALAAHNAELVRALRQAASRVECDGYCASHRGLPPAPCNCNAGKRRSEWEATLASTPADAAARLGALGQVAEAATAVLVAIDDRTDDRLLRWGEPIEVELVTLRGELRALAQLDAVGKREG